MENNSIKRGTFIHGIAASQSLDSSGERIDIAGVDISSLTKDAIFNYEHDSKSPSSIVGKIWEAKKIMKRSDCENDHHKYFWDDVKTPYIYVAGELFDGVGHKEASEIAAMVRFDTQASLNKDAKKLINFSIEGSRVEKTGSTITKCIARKVSITITPCNKTCIAEELKMDISGEKKTDSGDFSFIQDIMGKAEEPSCQIMKGEVSFLYKNQDIKIPAKDAVKEHKRLVAVLESPSHKDDRVEAKEQRKELKEYKGKAKLEKLDPSFKPNPKDPILNPAKFAPKARTASEQKEYGAKVTELQGKKKNKLSKYDSSVRKTLTASCGLGSSPATKVQGDAVAKTEFLYEAPLSKSEYKGIKGVGNPLGETQTGKKIFSHAKIMDYQGFSPQDHADAAEFHRQALTKLPSIKDKEHHLNKIRLHQAAFSSGREKQIKQQAVAKPVGSNPVPNYPKGAGTMGYSAQATNYGKQPSAPSAPTPTAPAIAPKMSLVPAPTPAPVPAPVHQTATLGAAPVPRMKIAKSESSLVRKPELSDLEKASKNVRDQRKKVFGSKSQPGANTAMRAKHISHVKNFVDKFLGLDLHPSGGKIDEETGGRRSDSPEVGVDKPDWRSGSLEAQWNPEAIVHEIAHLMLMPQGVGLEEGQRLMDKQYGDVQKEHGYMQQKRSKFEVQPMAAEQLIRRFIGLPASQVSIPVKSKDAPPRTAVDNPGEVIGTRVKQGQTKAGEDKYVDLIRQARNLHPEHRQRLQDVFSKKIVFDPDKGWVPNQSIDAKINAKPQMPQKSSAAPIQPQAEPEQAPNVVRMKQPSPPSVDSQDQINPPEMGAPKMKIAKSEQREVMKILGNEAFDRFEKKEDLLKFLEERLPNLSEKERLAIAKAVAYTSEKKKELALKSLMEEDSE